MGILKAAEPAIVIGTRDHAAHLRLLSRHARANGGLRGQLRPLRISAVTDFTPHEHTILGFIAPDVAVIVKALVNKGLIFNLLHYLYPGFNQDKLGILTAPGEPCARLGLRTQRQRAKRDKHLTVISL